MSGKSCKRIQCHKCSLDFGQEKRFLEHLVDEHGIIDYEGEYVTVFLGGIYPVCGCSVECGERLKWAGWKVGYTSRYVRGHNAVIDSVYLNRERQKEFSEKRRNGYVGGKYEVWNKGLTKDSSERVALSSQKISETLKDLYSTVPSWQVGLTTDTDERVKNFSDARKKKLDSGEIKVWNKGKTKHDDVRIELVAQKVSNFHSQNNPVRLSTEELVNRISDFPQFRLLTSLEEYRNKNQKMQFQCNFCGGMQQKSLAMLQATPVCHICCPKESRGQIELFDFVQSLKPDAILSDRNVIAPKELDVWIPSLKLGIEYNGLYWHSEKFLDKDYHENKFRISRDVGIRLFSVFEDEWKQRRHIVEGMLRHRLHVPIQRYDARKLKLVMLESSTARDFFNLTHLEGAVQSKISLGLVDTENDSVVAGMSLRRPFHKKYEGYLEVGRCSTLPGISVRGWLGRLTKAAIAYAGDVGAKGLLTYVDSRVGEGVGYEAAGWKELKTSTTPRFWWTDGTLRYNRFKFRACPNRRMSQEEVALEAGVFKIWGLPNKLFVIEI